MKYSVKKNFVPSSMGFGCLCPGVIKRPNISRKKGLWYMFAVAGYYAVVCDAFIVKYYFIWSGRLTGVIRLLVDIKLHRYFYWQSYTLWLWTITLTFQFLSYPPLVDLKKMLFLLTCFSIIIWNDEWNFTDMFNTKGYILWQKTVTLAFLVCELSAFW